MRIAFLDNDRDQAESFRQELMRAGHVCQVFRNSPELIGALEHDDVDALVLNWQESESLEHQLIRTAVAHKRPVLLLAPRSDENRIVAALAAGAGDYLVKPVRHGEIQIRMQVLLKRAYPETLRNEELHVGPYTFEPGIARVARNGVAIDVTQKEFELALLFFRHLGRPLSRAYILEAIWSREADIPSRTIDTHVSRVRNKLGLRPENGFRLLPVYSYGYQLEQLAPAQ